MMFDLTKLPEAISSKIAGRKWNCDSIGMSDSTILLFDEMVLRIEKKPFFKTRKNIAWLA